MNDFEVLVETMRTAQRNYFNTRDKYWLEESKKYEKLVDQHINNKRNPKIGFNETQEK